MAVIWIAAPCNLVEIYQSLTCLLLPSLQQRQRQQAPLKRRYLCTRLQNAITQETAIFCSMHSFFKHCLISGIRVPFNSCSRYPRTSVMYCVGNTPRPLPPPSPFCPRQPPDVNAVTSNTCLDTPSHEGHADSLTHCVLFRKFPQRCKLSKTPQSYHLSLFTNYHCYCYCCYYNKSF
jgi:hypothetical protein